MSKDLLQYEFFIKQFRAIGITIEALKDLQFGLSREGKLFIPIFTDLSNKVKGALFIESNILSNIYTSEGESLGVIGILPANYREAVLVVDSFTELLYAVNIGIESVVMSTSKDMPTIMLSFMNVVLLNDKNLELLNFFSNRNVTHFGIDSIQNKNLSELNQFNIFKVNTFNFNSLPAEVDGRLSFILYKNGLYLVSHDRIKKIRNYQINTGEDIKYSGKVFYYKPFIRKPTTIKDTYEMLKTYLSGNITMFNDKQIEFLTLYILGMYTFPLYSSFEPLEIISDSKSKLRKLLYPLNRIMPKSYGDIGNMISCFVKTTKIDLTCSTIPKIVFNTYPISTTLAYHSLVVCAANKNYLLHKKKGTKIRYNLVLNELMNFMLDFELGEEMNVTDERYYDVLEYLRYLLPQLGKEDQYSNMVDHFGKTRWQKVYAIKEHKFKESMPELVGLPPITFGDETEDPDVDASGIS